MTPEQRVQRILEEAVGSDLSSWEKFEFLPNIKDRTSLSEKQESILLGIERRIFKGEELNDKKPKHT